jgi:endonuclease YncB( thermonuclease family)
VKKTITTLLGLLSLVWSIPSIADTISGRVVGVSDGDTLTVLDSTNHQTRIRLHQIDAPEKNQDFGARSKQSLSDLVFEKSVTVEVDTTDKYGRTVGKVLIGGVDANLEQVKRGMAWVYRQYAHDQAYYTAEETARQARVGLWSQPNPIPPWEFRHGGHGAASLSPSPPAPASVMSRTGSSASSSTCGGKHSCKDMASCEEARFYLETCGLKALDRDGDGRPCESLCK